MRKICLPVFAALLALSPVRGSGAEPPPVAPAPDPDAKCLLIFNRLGAMLARGDAALDEQGRGRRDYAMAGLAYYTARLAQRHPGPSLDAAITATSASFPENQYPAEGARCTHGFGEAMGRVASELRNSSAAPAQPASSADTDLICLAVFTDAGQRIRAMPATRAPELTAYLASLSVGTPFYVARVLPRHEPGRLGPVLQAALRDFPRERAETLLRGCFDEMTRVTARVSRASEQATAPHPPAH